MTVAVMGSAKRLLRYLAAQFLHFRERIADIFLLQTQ